MATRNAKPVDPLHSLYQQIGEVTAGIRSINHSVNGISQKVDGVDSKVDSLALIVAAQGHLREDVNTLKAALDAQSKTITTLQADKHRKEGERGVMAWIVRNGPWALVMSAIVAAVTWANGKLPV